PTSDDGTPNLFDPSAGASSAPRPAPPVAGADTLQHNDGTPQSIQRPPGVTMQPASVVVAQGKPTQVTSSDGVLSVQVPDNAFSAQDLQAAGGSLSLDIAQVDPPSGSIAGGSGQVWLGTYLLQVVDANGVLAQTGLAQPVTVTFHLGPKPPALD